MIEKYCDGVVPDSNDRIEIDALDSTDLATARSAMDGSRGYLCHEALACVARLTERANLHIQQTQPWVLAKDPANRTKLEETLAALARSLARQAAYLAPFMPGKAETLWSQLGAPGTATGALFSEVESMSAAGWRVSKGEGLFPRPQ
jgi:methionyl-tRNA synthetase